MSVLARQQTMVQLRRLLRRLDHAHTSDESACPACQLQRLALQLNEELEADAAQLANRDLGPGAASVVMAIESVLTVIYALDVRAADEQGRVLQALLDYVGDVVLDQLAHDAASGAPETAEDATPADALPARRSGSLH